MLGGRDQQALEDAPVGDADVAVAQIGPGDVEGEDDRVGAEHGHQLHPVAEEEDEGRDRSGLDQRRAQREQDTLDRVGAVDRERRQRLGRVVHPVEAPEHRPGMEPAVQQVPCGVVEQEEDDGESGRHRPARRPREHERASVEPDMHGLEQQRRHGELRDQARRDAHHRRLVEDGDPVIGPGRARPPDARAEQNGERASRPAPRGDPLERQRQRERAGEVAQEHPLSRVQELVGEAVDEVDDEAVHGNAGRVSRFPPRSCRRARPTAPSSRRSRRCCAP